MNDLAWFPCYTLTPSIARWLMEIEAARAVVEHTPLPPTVEAELRHRARLRSTHYSTRIEGNRLSLGEAAQVIEGQRHTFQGRERDVGEVQHYWNALLKVEEWAAQNRPLTEDLIQRLHALVEYSPRSRPTPYRDGQNVIRDSASGGIVYLPPEAQDVPGLMSALVAWVQSAEKDGVPVPLIAGLVHYQFVTIHPNYDGNRRTARLLDIIENYSVFAEAQGGLKKLVAKCHQYFGVENTVEKVKTLKVSETFKVSAGQLGVFWHTQGSGKSYSMVFFAQKVLRKLPGN